MTLLAGMRDFFLRNGFERTYWIAYSGGMDSHVLLSLCYELRKELPLTLRAIHVNHHLHAQADEWARHCQSICQTYDVDLFIRGVFLAREEGESLEALAREKRYAMLASYLQANDMVLTAHHQDDQAETILLQLLRGAGVQGLAAMPCLKKLGKGWHARPLLPYTQEQLRDVALASKQSWIEDTSNQDERFARNYLRHTIFPLLKKHWPAATQTLARSAMHCAETQENLKELTLPLLTQCRGRQAYTLSVSRLLQLSLTQQRLVLRAWIQEAGFVLPNAKKMLTIVNTVLLARQDKMPCVKWGNAELRRYGDDLYLLTKLPQPAIGEIYSWRVTEELHLSSVGKLIATPILGAGLRLPAEVLQVQFRQGGEIVTTSQGRRPLKKLLQEWRIPPWLRDRTPLIFHQAELIAIPGYYLHDQYKACHTEVGYDLQLNG